MLHVTPTKHKAVMDRNLNELLKWSIEAQTAGQTQNGASTTAVTAADGNNSNGSNNATGAAPSNAVRELNPELLKALLGGPSDAELMQQAMAVITSSDPEVSVDDKLTAFDNFEQLIENLDNANNMPNLGLWTPLLEMLDHAESELRLYAAWCIGTAVQNNEKSQERLLAMGTGGLPRLVKMAVDGAEKEGVRRKATYALSSAVRNYQPAMDAVAAELEKGGQRTEGQGKVDATNMDAVDEVMNALKEQARKDNVKA